jgi:Mn2+/Fe2+ NRAMP family transporter
MGKFVNSGFMRIIAWIVVGLIVSLNVALIVLTAIGAT